MAFLAAIPAIIGAIASAAAPVASIAGSVAGMVGSIVSGTQKQKKNLQGGASDPTLQLAAEEKRRSVISANRAGGLSGTVLGGGGDTGTTVLKRTLGE